MENLKAFLKELKEGYKVVPFLKDETINLIYVSLDQYRKRELNLKIDKHVSIYEKLGVLMDAIYKGDKSTTFVVCRVLLREI